MKKFVPLLILSLLLGLYSGCGRLAPAETSPPATFPAAPGTAPSEELSTQPPTAEPTQAPTQAPTEAPTQPPTEAPTVPPYTPVVQYEDMKAMWLSQYDLTGIYLSGGKQRDVQDFTLLMEQVLDNVQSQGFNTVFLQVRPNADSMYPSAYYPMSAYVVGKTGQSADYDPVEIIVRLAHERSLSIHGWINPMRGMTEAELEQVSPEFLLRQWADDPDLRGRYIVSVSGRWYLNPAYGPVRDLIVSGARELLERYDFDGLHMDDYFYPTTDSSFDADAYEGYQMDGGTKDLADYRRNNLNRLVSELYTVTHDSRPGCILGISPTGNVNTVYNSQYADVYSWCSEAGYIDYICPQVYFGLEHGSYDFVKVSRQYQDMIQTDTVDLIVGMTFGKAFTGEDTWAGSGKDEWKDHKDVLERCLQTTLALEKCRGVAVFCYQYFFDPLTGGSIPETQQERENFVPAFRDIGWTAKG